MKKLLTALLCTGLLALAACKKETLTNTPQPAEQPVLNGTADYYCRCNPCDPNISWSTADVQLTPKMVCCREGCSGSLSHYSTYKDSSNWIYNAISASAYISLTDQAIIIQNACSTATAHRPPGKIIVSVEIMKAMTGFPIFYFGLYIKATYARCSAILPQDQDRVAGKQ